MRWPIPMRSQHGTSVVSRVGTKGGHPGTRRAYACTLHSHRLDARITEALLMGTDCPCPCTMPMRHAPRATHQAPRATRNAEATDHALMHGCVTVRAPGPWPWAHRA